MSLASSMSSTRDEVVARKIGAKPRTAAGRFVQMRCTDPNCDGTLVWEDGSSTIPGYRGRVGWRCNGLTHVDDNGPLIACDRSVDD